MTFQFIQKPRHVDSTANPPTYTTHWTASGEVNSATVRAYAMGFTPSMVAAIQGTLYRQDIRLTQTSYNQFDVDVPYGTRKNETGDWTWGFDTTGGRVHITQAKEEVGRFPADTAPDQKGAIAVDGDEVKGTEITIPAMVIDAQFTHPLGVVTIPYAKYLRSLTGSVNTDPFLGHAPGEVLFLGARGRDGSVAEATLDYFFATEENLEGETIGDIANVAKKGWDSLWIRYEDADETADGVVQPIRKPKFVYVDRVYKETALATALGFGG